MSPRTPTCASVEARLSGRRPACEGGDSAPNSSRPPRGYNRWLHDGLSDLGAESAILAIGCEEAFLAPHLTSYAADVTVLDTSGGQLAQLASRFPEISFLSHHPTRLLPFAAQTFAAVCCSEFLDRVFDPVAALREIRRVLAPSGRLLVSVADHGAIGKMWGLFRREEEMSAHPRLHAFTRGSLAKMLRESGFAEVHATTVASGGDSRREPAARRLLVAARKAPELQRMLAPSRLRGRRFAGIFAEEPLAFAGRVRAA